MATIKETQTERFDNGGVLKVDAAGRVLTRREYAVEGVRYGRETEIGRFDTRKEAEACARQEERREAAVKAQHLSGWAECPCPDCR